MLRSSFLTATCLFAAGCAPTLAGEEAPSFKPELADGHALSEHTEVAPGVFVLTSRLDAGSVRYVSHADAEAREDARARRPHVESCYNYEYANYSDEVRNDTLFNGNTSWYGVVNAISYDYDAPGTDSDQDYESVMAYLWTASEHPITTVTASAYVYINSEYAGFVSDAQANATTALTYETFDAECVDGRVAVEVFNYHSWTNMGPDQSLYLSNRTSTAVECCPS
jgi:hypothetical protein